MVEWSIRQEDEFRPSRGVHLEHGLVIVANRASEEISPSIDRRIRLQRGYKAFARSLIEPSSARKLLDHGTVDRRDTLEGQVISFRYLPGDLITYYPVNDLAQRGWVAKLWGMKGGTLVQPRCLHDSQSGRQR